MSGHCRDHKIGLLHICCFYTTVNKFGTKSIPRSSIHCSLFCTFSRTDLYPTKIEEPTGNILKFVDCSVICDWIFLINRIETYENVSSPFDFLEGFREVSSPEIGVLHPTLG